MPQLDAYPFQAPSGLNSAGPSPHSTIQGLGTISGPTFLAPCPLPDDFWSLPPRERRHFEKERAREMRMMKDWQKAQVERERAEILRLQRQEKEKAKMQKKDIKCVVFIPAFLS
jgi:hypothetical protein